MNTQLQTELKALTEWQIQDGKLCRTFTFKDFVAAIAFVQNIMPIAEKLKHHPDIDIRYNKVTLRLTTHDAGEITAKDVGLAKNIESHTVTSSLS